MDQQQKEAFEAQRAIDRKIRETALLKAMDPATTLEDLTWEEERELGMIEGAPQLRRLRVEAFERRASQFEKDPTIRAFLGSQIAQHGPRVVVWGNKMSWLAAFLVVRYGENLTHWPSRDEQGLRRYSEADRQRATQWAIRGEWPEGVTKYVKPSADDAE